MGTKLRVGIVGLGRAGRGMQADEIMKFPDKFEIVAGCDNAQDRLKGLPQAFQNARLYDDYGKMLADKEIDIIAIATRHQDHAPMGIRALQAGKCVSVDKPCAVSLAEMDALLAEGEKHPGKLFLRHNRRFESPFRKVMQLLQTGVLGEIHTVKLYRSVGYCRRNDWMTMSRFFGGLFTNWGPHIVDQALQLLGGRVVDCWADIRSVISIGDADDHIKLLLRTESGRVADIEISGAHTLPGREIEIQGSKGTLVYPEDGRIKMRYVDPALELKDLQPHPENPGFQYGNFDEKLTFIEQLVEIPPVAGEGAAIWLHIYDAIVNGVPFPIEPGQAREVVRVMELAFSASQQARSFILP